MKAEGPQEEVFNNFRLVVHQERQCAWDKVSDKHLVVVEGVLGGIDSGDGTDGLAAVVNKRFPEAIPGIDEHGVRFTGREELRSGRISTRSNARRIKQAIEAIGASDSFEGSLGTGGRGKVVENGRSLEGTGEDITEEEEIESWRVGEIGIVTGRVDTERGEGIGQRKGGDLEHGDKFGRQSFYKKARIVRASLWRWRA